MEYIRPSHEYSIRGSAVDRHYTINFATTSVLCAVCIEVVDVYGSTAGHNKEPIMLLQHSMQLL